LLQDDTFKLCTFAKNIDMSDFHSLSINTVSRLTPDAVAIAFDIPEILKEKFQFLPGQYLTLKTKLNGTEVRRAYSICSSPQSGVLKVAVKAVKDGTFSVFANTQLKKGDQLEVHPPEGKFVLNPAASKNYAAFAAGSGITPILSMIKTVLETTADSKFVLVYGNKRKEDVIFGEELIALRENYPDRFSIEWIYSQSREDNAHFGRISKPTVNFVVKNKYTDWNFDSYYLCGPEPMINEVSNVLQENGISESQILFELFTSSDEGEVSETLDGQSEIHIIVDDETFDITMAQDSIILDAALEADIDAPHSCQGGICSSCIARITEGTATMRKNQILTDREVAEGLILTCQAHPTSAKIVVDYDDV